MSRREKQPNADLATSSIGGDFPASGQVAIDRDSPAYRIGLQETAAGSIPIVATDLTVSDKLGGFKVRWGIGRMYYRVDPGLYGVGQPDSDSPVFVSANYKLSFDRLRRSLKGVDAWILVLDTRGINVWCAAGKGTFGTQELIGRVFSTQVSRVVKHRRLILPQLGAPGVAAHEVKSATGFRVIYGPVRAEDIKLFLDRGQKASPEMRRVKFTAWDRLVLTPFELMQGLKWAVLAAALLGLLSGLGPDGFSVARLLEVGLTSAILVLLIFLAGVLLPPLLLPWLPGHSFAARGLAVGLALVAVVLAAKWSGHGWVDPGWLGALGWSLMIPATVSFLATNFTGCSTFTSLSGVEQEMERWLPLQIGAAVIGLVLWLVGRFLQI